MTEKIEILNMHNTPVTPDLCIRIDRMTKWGNPYKMQRESDRLDVIQKYTYYILDSKLLNNLHELESKWLCCWCYPKPCHGNVLKYLCEHPEVVKMYKKCEISRDGIVNLIWKDNGWKHEIKGKQMTLNV